MSQTHIPFSTINDACVLTQEVIFEKASAFGCNGNPNNISYRDWKKMLIKLESEKRNHHEVCQFIGENIIGPLIKSEFYLVSPTIYNPDDFQPMKMIMFKNGKRYNLGPELMSDLTSYFPYDKVQVLKDIVVSLCWNE